MDGFRKVFRKNDNEDSVSGVSDMAVLVFALICNVLILFAMFRNVLVRFALCFVVKGGGNYVIRKVVRKCLDDR